MKDTEKKILETFASVLPQLTQEQREHLLWFGEGLAFKSEAHKKPA